MTDYGILSLLPVAVVIVLVFFTKRTAVSLLVGTLVGAVMLYGTGFAKPWLDVVYGVMGSDLWIWLVLVCGFFGSLVALFEASGGIHGFTAIAAKVCKGEKRTLVASWILGIVTFVDDWLSILSVGTAMRRATDRFHIPREMLAFLSNATATSICVIVPTSTWGVFMISQLVATDVCTSEAGMSTFVQVLPFLFYPLVALLCGFLYSVGILPKIGPMRKAYALAKEQTAPVEESPVHKSGKKPHALNFLLPIVLVTVVTILTREILYGTLLCLVFCALLYLPQKLLTPGQFLDTVMSGFKSMIGVLAIVTCAFMLRDINSLLGMPRVCHWRCQGSYESPSPPGCCFLDCHRTGCGCRQLLGDLRHCFPGDHSHCPGIGCQRTADGGRHHLCYGSWIPSLLLWLGGYPRLFCHAD